MTNEEKKQQIEAIYNTAHQKILDLQKQQEIIIRQYIIELEQKKIASLREDIINSL